MDHENALRSLDFFGKTRREYALDSAEVRERKLEQQLQSPPEDLNERQTFLNGIPNHLIKEFIDLFVPLSKYCKDVLDLDFRKHELSQVAEFLVEKKLVPVIPWQIIGKTRSGSKKSYTRFLVSLWDYERGIEKSMLK